MKKIAGAFGFESLPLQMRRGLGLMLALLVLGGVSQATPIIDLMDTGAQAAAAARTMRNTQAAAVASLETQTGVAATNFYTLNITNWSAPTANTCTLTGDCKTTTKIPEPQSLVLVGSGLLSMAGFIRRRFAR